MNLVDVEVGVVASEGDVVVVNGGVGGKSGLGRGRRTRFGSLRRSCFHFPSRLSYPNLGVAGEEVDLQVVDVYAHGFFRPPESQLEGVVANDLGGHGIQCKREGEE